MPTRILSVALIVLLLTLAALLVTLAVRRLARLSAERHRDRVLPELRLLAAALITDGEFPPPLPPRDSALLASVLWEFSRQITGTSREEIAAYFESVGLVDRELRLLSSRRGWRRAEAAYVLGDACSNRAVPALIERLDDADPQVVAAAARSLGRLRASQAVEPLASTMAAGRLPYPLGGTILIDIRTGVVPTLSWLLHHPEPRARAGGVELFGVLGSADDTGWVYPLLTDPAPQVRSQACRALGRLGDAEALPPLLARLSDPEPEVRAAAADALGEVGDPRALPELLAQARQDVFEPAQAAANAVARTDGARLLEAAADPDSGPHLAEAASRVGAASTRSEG
ncbi:HEAT repeat domain-containing protein [Natronosporangium hydrolyticum]|uniref:HEAT repeat domain-containing protein n=1 Tax=Natronosporangium hydrolyticum TaxID=2811111 RepID=A0A895YQQ0_9ACTN|nr:HEAT repeat domain-containing protein [Natronosporangium hydrolyticum]QSB16450.1 HEAT repeat domain-containing protein [Natronosporangium hydrolyticum]